MPRLSKKVKTEWSFFINPRTGKRQYALHCQHCIHLCKQSYRAQILACPNYQGQNHVPETGICSDKLLHKCPTISKRWADGVAPCLLFERPLHGRIGAKHAPTQGDFRLVYVALVHRPSLPPVAVRFAAMMITQREAGGKPRGEAQGCTTISVVRKAAGKGTAICRTLAKWGAGVSPAAHLGNAKV